ncbi:MAG TPA: hypothetical protein PLU22_08130, partial [Polyangiaceae bacterium]|nr:hypothetical protein [Polyangiaceae bacterium]
NAIEAIQRTGRSGRLVWGYEQIAGVRKLSILDTGDGMSADELQRYLNHLSSSGSRQGFDANYGIGAKISTVVRNPSGVVYMSWKDGVGHMIQPWRDPSTGEYGLAPLADGEHVVRLRAEARRPEIPDSGTLVVLLGTSEEDDTFSARADLPGRTTGRWVRKYLNTRYFRLPDGVSIDCRTSGSTDEGYRYVSGMEPMLEAVALARGQVALTAATAHWWIIPAEGAALPKPVTLAAGTKPIHSMRTFQPSHYYKGHVAALYADELYDVFQGPSARTWLQNAGVTFGYDQVVIYVEPEPNGVLTDTARSRLIIDGGSLPWASWQDELRERLPKEIRDFVEQSAPREEKDADVDQRIRSIADLFRSQRARPAPNGRTQVAPPDAGGASDPSAGPTPRPMHPRAPNRPAVSRRGCAYGELVDTGVDADPATQKAPAIPRIVWVTARGLHPTRADDEYSEYAAWYVAAEDTIKANLDFPLFDVIEAHLLEDFGGRPGAQGVVRTAIRGWYDQTLKETVLGLRALVGSGEWTNSSLRERLTGDQGALLLTAAAMPRYAALQWMKREVSRRIGKARSSQAATTTV